MTRVIGRWILILLSVFAITAQAAVPENTVRLHYNRSGNDYAGWGLHAWGTDVDFKKEVSWERPLPPSGRDDFGIYFDIPIRPDSNAEVGFIIHLGDEKNVAKNMHLFPSIHGHEVWQLEGDSVIYKTKPNLSAKPEPANGKFSAILQPLPPEVKDKLDPQAREIIDKIRADAEARLQLQGRNQARLEADLLTEQQARKAAEEQVIALPAAKPAPEPSLIKSFAWPASLGAVLLIAALMIFQTRRHQAAQVEELHHLQDEIEKANSRAQKEVEERQSAEQRILQLANYDELTSLPNRAILNQTITQALAKAKRYKKQLAILFIDLDRFKFINDTMGHGAGDYVLKTISERFKQCLRETDTIARLGGDEFVVLIEALSDPKYVAGVAQKLVVSAQQAFVIEGQECHVTASIGISTYPNDGKDASTLLKNADIAMYRAKEQGKNNFQYYSEQMNLHLLQRLALESSLRHAVDRHELQLYYQPIVETESLEIVGVEALVRWRHPDMGMVGPLQFIPLAEETGLIVQIGRWVLQSACEQGRIWNEMGFPLNISVNMSPRQLAEPDIVQDFSETFAKSGFPPTQLTLEITESLMLNNPDETVVILQELKELGPRIAIDDFGTGYSSLAYLRRFPIDTLKIDRSFLQDIPSDADSSVLTAAVIALSHSMHLNVVAEGVETDEQRDFLVSHHCQRLQGYWFAKPQPAEELTQLLQKSKLG